MSSQAFDAILFSPMQALDKRKMRPKRFIRVTRAATLMDFTTVLINFLMSIPRMECWTAERRGEYERKKMGTGRNATTCQIAFFQLCFIIRMIVAPNATAIIETERIIHIIPCISFLKRYFSKCSNGNEDVRMERNIPTDVKAKVRENTSAKMKTTKKGLQLRIGIPVL